MGAANALLAYRTYGSAIGDRALRMLIYMALVARDRDSEPWCSIGHEAIAEFALSRTVPGHDDTRGRKLVLRIVERGMTELADAGAIRTMRRATFGRHGVTPARYRLYLDQPCSDTRAPKATRQKSTGNPPVTEQREVVPSTRQILTLHPSNFDAPPVTERRTKEKEELGGAITTGVLQSTRDVESYAAEPSDLSDTTRMSVIEAAAWAAVGRS